MRNFWQVSKISKCGLKSTTLKTAVESDQPQRVLLDAKGTDCLLPGAHTQIVIPLRREATVIGLVLLENE